MAKTIRKSNKKETRGRKRIDIPRRHISVRMSDKDWKIFKKKTPSCGILKGKLLSTWAKMIKKVTK